MPRTYGTTNVMPYAAAPTVGAAGDEYYNSTDKKLYLADGTVWNPVPSSPVTLTAHAATELPLTINGAAGQSVNLIDIKNSGGTDIFLVNQNGVAFAQLLQSAGQVLFTNGLGALNEYGGSTTAAGATLWFCNGVPPTAMGQNGDFALRFDGTVGGQAVLYHKESGAWIASGAPATAEVAATAPNASAPPAVTPPGGLLWVDTSTATPTSAPYTPPQAPPPTGNNYFTDAAGEAWVSQAGGVWKKCRDVLYCRVWKTAAWQFPAAANALGWDVVESDVYAINSPGSGLQPRFTAPVAGLYHLDCLMSTGAAPTAGQYILLSVYKNGVSYAGGGQASMVSGGNWPVVMISVTTRLNATDYLETWKGGSVALTGATGQAQTWASFYYVGSG